MKVLSVLSGMAQTYTNRDRKVSSISLPDDYGWIALRMKRYGTVSVPVKLCGILMVLLAVLNCIISNVNLL